MTQEELIKQLEKEGFVQDRYCRYLYSKNYDDISKMRFVVSLDKLNRNMIITKYLPDSKVPIVDIVKYDNLYVSSETGNLRVRRNNDKGRSEEKT